MTTAELAILGLLAGHDSKNPLPFDDLVKASGLFPATLEMVLNQMFETVPHPVNCAQITRAGKTQMVYWPTGVVAPAISLGRQAIDQKKRPTFPKVEPAPRQQQPIQEEPMPQAEPTKSRARVLLEYLADHRSADGATLCQVAGIESISSYLGGHFKRGLILVSDDYIKGRGKTYTVAEGVTREQLLADGRKKNLPPHEQKAAKAEAPAAPASNVHEFKPTNSPRPPAGEGQGVREELGRQYTAHHVFVDATGQLVIQQTGMVRMVFPAPDTLRIQKLLLAIDLESLCV